LPFRWRVQAADQLHGARSVWRSVEADDDLSHTRGLSTHHEHGTLSSADNTTRDTAHQQATRSSIAAPTYDDDVGSESLGLAQNGVDR
jgi:hypothetical protein